MHQAVPRIQQTCEVRCISLFSKHHSSVIHASCGAYEYVSPGRWCPEENANVWSRLFFCYVDSILRLGYSKPLNQEDIWDLAERDRATK